MPFVFFLNNGGAGVPHERLIKQPLVHKQISCVVSVFVVHLCVLVVVISVCGSCCLCGLVAVRCVGLFAVAGRLPLWGVLRLVWAAESWLWRAYVFIVSLLHFYDFHILFL